MELTQTSRLTFRHWPSFSPDYAAEVEVAERLSGKRTERVVYAVREVTRLPSGARQFEVRKQGTPADSAYKVCVFRHGSTCTCPGSTHRRQQGTCKHKGILTYLLTEGVL